MNSNKKCAENIGSLYCNVTHGENMCGVCMETSYFDVRSPTLTYRERAGKRVAMMQLFRCGHSLCSYCFDELVKRDPYTFSCPFCRSTGAYFRRSLESLERKGPAHTLAQWTQEYRSYLELGMLRGSFHPFMILLRSISQKACQAQLAKKKIKMLTEESRALDKGRISKKKGLRALDKERISKKKGLRPACNSGGETVRKGRKKQLYQKINDIEHSRLLKRREQLVEGQLRLRQRNHRRSLDKAKTFKRSLRRVERRLRDCR